MRSQTFVGKVGIEPLRLMDDQINSWMERNQVEPKLVNQVFGYERQHHHGDEEPVIVTTIWY